MLNKDKGKPWVWPGLHNHEKSRIKKKSKKKNHLTKRKPEGKPWRDRQAAVDSTSHPCHIFSHMPPRMVRSRKSFEPLFVFLTHLVLSCPSWNLCLPLSAVSADTPSNIAASTLTGCAPELGSVMSWSGRRGLWGSPGQSSCLHIALSTVPELFTAHGHASFTRKAKGSHPNRDHLKVAQEPAKVMLPRSLKAKQF